MQAIKTANKKGTTGLGYKPTRKNRNKKSRRTEENIWPSFSSLNGFFVKEGEDFPYCGFQEPWKNADGEWGLGWEIFYEEDLYTKNEVIHSFGTKVTIKQETNNMTI